jgi:hypothetical protein
MADIQDLRAFYNNILQGFLRQIEQNDSVFAEERSFFLRQSLKDQEVQRQLTEKIEHLQKEL